MIKVSEIYKKLNLLAEVGLAQEYDNVGIICGEPDGEVKKVLIALDVTDEVIREAQSGRFELIVTHHPVCFEPVKKITSESSLYKLIRTGISVISMHTNLDRAEGGTDDTLANILKIKEACPIGAFGRIGRAAEDIHSMSDLLVFVKNALNAHGLKYYDSGTVPHIVATVAGSGGDFLEDAISAGCDTFITGELKYHHYIEAKNRGINLIEAGHFSTENPICNVLSSYLSKQFPSISVKIANSNKDMVNFFQGDNI